jgi:hypothetical protein
MSRRGKRVELGEVLGSYLAKGEQLQWRGELVLPLSTLEPVFVSVQSQGLLLLDRILEDDLIGERWNTSSQTQAIRQNDVQHHQCSAVGY